MDDYLAPDGFKIKYYDTILGVVGIGYYHCFNLWLIDCGFENEYLFKNKSFKTETEATRYLLNKCDEHLANLQKFIL